MYFQFIFSTALISFKINCLHNLTPFKGLQISDYDSHNFCLRFHNVSELLKWSEVPCYPNKVNLFSQVYCNI